MSSLSVDELILSPEAYASVRPARRADAIAQRRGRRVVLGDLVTLEFESVDTLRYQAQEMLYVERIVDPSAAAMELASYERLLPTTSSIAATMLIEIQDADGIRGVLGLLNGLHDAIQLQVADLVSPARDIPPPGEGLSAHTSSVHFLRFDLPPAMLALLRAESPAQLVADHPHYQATVALSPEFISLVLGDVAAAAG